MKLTELVAGARAKAAPVPIPWTAEAVLHPATGVPLGRFGRAKAQRCGAKWSRDDFGVSDLEAGFRPLSTFDAYDRIAIQISGGKDSVAALAKAGRLLAKRPDLLARIELWHQDVDGNGPAFMDWPVTLPYIEALGALYEVPVLVSWREGGFLGEIRRGPDQPRGRKMWRNPFTGEAGAAGRPPTKGNERGRLRFPLPKPADMNARWCTNELKTDVAKGVVATVAAPGERVLWITGERAEESRRRAGYHRGQDGNSTQGRGNVEGRTVHQLRIVYDHSELEVWDELRFAFPGKPWGLQAHPTYELGWGRCSCAGCIFGDGAEWARLCEVLPEQYRRIVAEEAVAMQHARAGVFGPKASGTIKIEGVSIPQLVAAWRAKNPGPAIPPPLLRAWGPYARGDAAWTKAHALRGPGAPVFRQPWVLPSGAGTPTGGPE